MPSELEEWVTPVKAFRVAPVTPASMGENPRDPFYTSIWFDQGGTTGWSVFCVWAEAMRDPNLRVMAHIGSWSAGQFTGSETSQVDQMMGLVEAWSDAAIVGLEDFVLMKLGGRELLSPVRIAAAFEDRMYCAGRRGQLASPQTASLAKGRVTDDRLKLWGLWPRVIGQDHARDAIRHNLTWLSRIKASNAKA